MRGRILGQANRDPASRTAARRRAPSTRAAFGDHTVFGPTPGGRTRFANNNSDAVGSGSGNRSASPPIAGDGGPPQCAYRPRATSPGARIDREHAWRADITRRPTRVAPRPVAQPQVHDRTRREISRALEPSQATASPRGIVNEARALSKIRGAIERAARRTFCPAAACLDADSHDERRARHLRYAPADLRLAAFGMQTEAREQPLIGRWYRGCRWSATSRRRRSSFAAPRRKHNACSSSGEITLRPSGNRRTCERGNRHARDGDAAHELETDRAGRPRPGGVPVTGTSSFDGHALGVRVHGLRERMQQAGAIGARVLAHTHDTAASTL